MARLLADIRFRLMNRGGRPHRIELIWHLFGTPAEASESLIVMRIVREGDGLSLEKIDVTDARNRLDATRLAPRKWRGTPSPAV